MNQNKIINPAQQIHGQQEIDAATRVLESGRWAEGPEAEKFKDALKEYLGVRHVVLTNSGSSANLAALFALTTEWIPDERRLKPGDEVITTALCFPTTVSPIIRSGAVPVFVDVEPGTWNIDPIKLREMISDKTKAIMVAHNLGNPINIDAILEICNEFGLWLIEDNCDALGSEYNGKKTGTFGHIGTSSFYPAHHISTGEGGAVYTNNGLLHRAIKSMVNWGRDCWCEPGEDDTCNKRYGWELGDLPYGYDHKNIYAEFGFNLKMTDIQAAIGTEQLKRLPEFNGARRHNFEQLRKFFEFWNTKVVDTRGWFELPEVYAGADPSWFGYVIKLKDAPFHRDDMVKYLDAAGIKSRAFFCGNITKQPAMHNRDDVKFRAGTLDVSDDIMNRAFWIGVHPGITQNDQFYIQSVLESFFHNCIHNPEAIEQVNHYYQEL